MKYPNKTVQKELPLPKCTKLCIALKLSILWVRLGAKFQQVIIGEADGDFESVDCESLFGIGGIDGLDTGEFEFPDVLFEESGCL